MSEVSDICEEYKSIGFRVLALVLADYVFSVEDREEFVDEVRGTIRDIVEQGGEVDDECLELVVEFFRGSLLDQPREIYKKPLLRLLRGGKKDE